MNKRLTQVLVAIVAAVVLFNWLGQQVKIDEKRRTVDGQILLKKLQSSQFDVTLMIFNADMCESLKASEVIAGDISKIESGQLLEQDLTPDAKALLASMDTASKDLKAALPSATGVSVDGSNQALGKRTLSFSHELRTRYLQLQKGQFEANRSFFLATPNVVTELGAKGCGSASPTTNPTPRASLLAKHPEFRSMNRDIANDVTCKLQLDLAKVQEMLSSINRGGSEVSAMNGPLRTLAEHLDEASQSTTWAQQDSPLPKDTTNIKKFAALSSLVYGLRVKYFHNQSKQEQEQIISLVNWISPLALQACNRIQTGQVKN